MRFNIGKEGSVMVLLVLVIAITTLLGTTIMCVSMINYKMKITNSDIINNSYSSESALDEGYALIIKTYDDSYNEAKNYITDFTQNINVDIQRIARGEISYGDSDYSSYISLDNKIRKDSVAAIFRAHFEELFFDSLSVSFSDFESNINPDFKLTASVGDFSIFHKSIINLKSEYEENSIKRFNSEEIVVTSPLVDTSYSESIVSDEAMAYNPLLSKPVFAQGNVYFNDSINTINGDMIILGSLINTEENSTISFTSNDLAVYGNAINTSKLTGSINLKAGSDLSGVNSIYTNSIYSNSSIHNICDVEIDGVDASEIIMDSTTAEVEARTLGLGVSNLADGFINDMKTLLPNIGKNPKNTIVGDAIDYHETQPVQLLYDIVKGGNIGAKKFAFTSTRGDDYYICSTNENSKSVYIFGPPYYFDNNQNVDSEKDSMGNCLNINARGIDSDQEIIYATDPDQAYDLNGIIVSAGDVHLLGDIDFEGSIICFGDLYIEGDGVKNLTNNLSTNLAWELMNSGDSFYDAFTGFDSFLKLDIPVENLSGISDISTEKPFKRRNWKVTYN
jgi:hypothetical protein